MRGREPLEDEPEDGIRIGILKILHPGIRAATGVSIMVTALLMTAFTQVVQFGGLLWFACIGSAVVGLLIFLSGVVQFVLFR